MRAVVFDLDGTLIHSAPQIHHDVNQMLISFGLDPLPYDMVVSFIGNGVPTLVARALQAAGAGDHIDHQDAVDRVLEIYKAASTAHQHLFPGVQDCLADLAARGLHLGVCTNRPQVQTRALLDRFGLTDRFASVVGGDRLPVSKPDPAPLRLCFHELGVTPDEGLFVGDSETDEATALNVGCPFALFTGGYRKKTPDAFTAVQIFDDFAELTPH